jgi:multifunctional beta-oxidation protein
MAASAMTETILPPDMLKGLKPEFIAPLVGVLTAQNVSISPRHTRRVTDTPRAPTSTAESLSWAPASSRRCGTNGRKVCRLRASDVTMLNGQGAVWRTDDSFTPSAVAAKWEEVANFTNAEHPVNSEDGDMMVSGRIPTTRSATKCFVLITRRAY